jgi:hypothetical protein
MGEYGFEDGDSAGSPRVPELATPATKTPQPVQRPGQKGKNVNQLDNITVATQAQAPGKPDPACRFGTCCEGVGYPCDLCAWHSRLIDDREQKALAFLIEEQARAVHTARQNLAMAKQAVDALRKGWELQNALHLEALADCKTVLAVEEDRLRGLAIEAYQKTGSKAPGCGVAVREMTRVRYDRRKALAWAVEHKIYVQLDTTPFEKFARANPTQVPFVEVYKEPEASISTDLGKALEG